MAKRDVIKNLEFPVIVRRLLLSWLIAATISYLVLSAPLRCLQTTGGIAQMSLIGTIIMTCIFLATFTIVGYFRKRHIYERWLMLITYTILAVSSLQSNFSWSFLVGCLLLWIVLFVYAVAGWNSSASQLNRSVKSPFYCKLLLYIMASAFVVFVSIWTVSRIYSYCTPTYDFGIFSQMFYNMKASGIPNTTVERDMLLSHFHVHVSPIYYLLLPIYCLFPFPATLQILQAIVLASTIIPLWLLCRRHGLSPVISLVLCGILLSYPAFSGGTSYDLHENAFLAPLLMWLFYGLDVKSIPITILSASLTLIVKEDAAVYVAVVSLYIFVRGAVNSHQQNRSWGLIIGSALLVASVTWFLIVTRFLATSGDGVMIYRYQNFMTNSSGSLLDVIKTVILCPLKVIFECTDSEKLKFIALTLLTLLGLPILTRKYERFILLIPYILVNLMSDYQYQHDIFFQYTFGSTACLLYLTVINLADMKHVFAKSLFACVCLAICGIFFIQNIVPVAARYPQMVNNNRDHYRSIRQTLMLIPDDASVAATTFYTTQLSQREILYDVKYTSLENLLSTEYVALAIHSQTNYNQYAAAGKDGYENLIKILESNGYIVFAELDDTLVIYQKQE